ncbi:MAG: hypothetical protein IRZ08_14805 [Frankia sp.]|nr:hypothetical protein [Frankia sp.]
MPWALVYLVLCVMPLVLMLGMAVGLLRKVKMVRASAGELRERVADFSRQTSELSARLELAEVTAKLAERGAR